MRFSVVYLVLVAFTFLSLTPAGVSLAELRADDSLDLDDLDLGLDESEEDEDAKASSDEKEADGEDEDLEDEGESESENESESESESESEKVKSKKLDEDSELSSDAAEAESPLLTGKKIAAFYVFEDSHTLKSAGHVAAETALELSNSKEYDYVATELSLFSFSSDNKGFKNARKNFEKGRKLYDEYSIDEAIEQFTTALKYLEDNMDKISDMKLLQDVLFYLGASYKRIDDDQQAKSYFLAYLAVNPDGEPSSDLLVEEVETAFEDAKRSVSRSSGSLKARCGVDGSVVFLDGRVVGISPVNIRKISAGKHYYRCHKNGYRDVAGVISVRAGKAVSINETMTKYSLASSIFATEREMKSNFGQTSMIRKTLDLAEELNLDNILVVKASIGADEKLTYSGIMIDKNKNEFKKYEVVLPVPDKERVKRSKELKEFNVALIQDDYEYQAISDLLEQEMEMLGFADTSQKDAKDKNKKPVYKEWWLWTVVGVVVLAGAGVGTYFALTAGGNDNKGKSTLEINFQ